MRFSATTFYAHVAICILLALADMDYPARITDIFRIDGGTIIFWILILAFSQLFTNKAFRFYHRVGDRITVGVLSTFMAIVTIYALGGIYYMANALPHHH